ncbi:MAG TPA: matrixin family metalloprotease [Verrucomicrobiae bacterium]|nr:matrixin family metalloprotease [Verrucomicrobiae bacterium]
MKMIARLSFTTILLGHLLALNTGTFASSIVPLSTAALVDESAVVFRGAVVGQNCFRDASGQIHTRTSLRVDKSFKGTFPSIVAVVSPGGTIGDETLYNAWSPFMEHGAEYLVFAVQRADGKLTFTQGSSSAIRLKQEEGELTAEQQALLNRLDELTNHGQVPGANVTDQIGFATSELTPGLTDRGGGIAARYVTADRGEAIPYLIDATTLPAGITLAQATNAVAQALNAWTAVTSLKFRFEGLQNFGQGADTINASDEKLRIQLHDNYNRINSASTLGVGGQYTSAVLLSGSGWGAGGNVAGNEFYKTSTGFVVLEHGAASMQNLLTFTEVLCHEIGHAISMAHSSENPSEPNNTLRQSIMYYTVHADGRGASLGSYDPPVIQQAYPTNNTPPYTYARVMDVTTDSPSQPNVPGINDVELRGYDLQNGSLTLLVTNTTANAGNFTRSGNILKFTANAFYSSPRIDPATSSFYDIAYVRCSDGPNASAYASVRAISHDPDSSPATSDGIPDSWMIAHWGSANPSAGPNRGAQQDFDGDGLKNIDEYRAGMDPTLASSAQIITLITRTNLEFQAKPYELYELHGSTNLVNWTRVANPIVPTSSTGTFAGFTSNAPFMFFRVQKVP